MIFDESLNLNYKYFINNNYNNLSLKDINNLMSKFIHFYFYIENKGIYKIKYCIGKGVTGRVSNKNIYFKIFKCRCLLNNEYYALKEIPKKKLFRFNKLFAAMKEPDILKKLKNYNFVPNIISSFQDYDNLYLIINYFEGNILFNYRKKYFSEEQIKFISACIIQSLFYLRKEEIINRDVRMKNIIMDKKRYLNLIDFSYSIKYSDKNISKSHIVADILETPPEMINHSIYDYNSDYYRIGVIMYYLIFKKFVNAVKRENNITQIIINHKNIKNYSLLCIDFMNKLLISDYKKRIGFKTIEELKNHLWFKGFDWKKFEKKKIKSPLKFMERNFKKNIQCKRFEITKKAKIKFKNKRYNTCYRKLIKNYDFVNKRITKHIFYSFKKKYKSGYFNK